MNNKMKNYKQLKLWIEREPEDIKNGSLNLIIHSIKFPFFSEIPFLKYLQLPTALLLFINIQQNLFLKLSLMY